MFTLLQRSHKLLALAVALLAAGLPACGAKEDFAQIAKRTLAETHAKNFREGNLPGCVALYAEDAKFFVDNKLVARGAKELLAFYKGLRDVDGIRTIEVEGLVDSGSRENTGWVIFNYTKDYELKGRDPAFIKSHKLEGFATLRIKQYGTAIFARIDGQWKIQVMSVFDPEIWEPRK